MRELAAGLAVAIVAILMFVIFMLGCLYSMLQRIAAWLHSLEDPK